MRKSKIQREKYHKFLCELEVQKRNKNGDNIHIDTFTNNKSITFYVSKKQYKKLSKNVYKGYYDPYTPFITSIGIIQKRPDGYTDLYMQFSVPTNILNKILRCL